MSRATADLPGARLGSAHLHVGPFAIHLRTARVTRDGDDVTPGGVAVDSSMDGWLPYADGLLSRILANAAWCSEAPDRPGRTGRGAGTVTDAPCHLGGSSVEDDRARPGHR